MQQTPSEVLLPIFKRLNCQEKVKARAVSKHWRSSIEEHQSLWRSAIYLKLKGQWNNALLQLYDEKSGGTLEKVSIHVHLDIAAEDEFKDHPDPRLLGISRRTRETLSRSQRTLRAVVLQVNDEASGPVGEETLDLSWKLPNLVKFRVMGDLSYRPQVTLV